MSLEEKKLKTFSQILEISDNNKNIGLINGCFDIFHLGHCKILEFASQQCDVLIVGVNSDSSVKKLKGDDRPINSEQDRARLLCHNHNVDHVFVFDETDAFEIVRKIKPCKYIDGSEYRGSLHREEEISDVRYFDCDEKSTTNLIEKLK